MVPVDILFKSGQVIVLNFDTPKQALEFVKSIKDADVSHENSLLHVSNQHDETVLNMRDISYVRLQKDTHFQIEQQQEDAHQEAKTRKQFEAMEIDEEINRMKAQQT